MYEDSIKARVELAKSKQYLDINDVMFLSGYSPSTIRRRIEKGQLKAIQNVERGKLLFRKKDVERWLEGGAL
jgi:predicted DNA-binding transcriptional regulator AlpA